MKFTNKRREKKRERNLFSCWNPSRVGLLDAGAAGRNMDSKRGKEKKEKQEDKLLLE